jgi:hypothetical protein
MQVRYIILEAREVKSNLANEGAGGKDVYMGREDF